MTIQTEFVYRLSELGIVLRAMHVVTGRATDGVLVHHALHEVVTLHPVLVCSSVGKVSECRLAKGDVFERPVVLEVKTNVITDRPVIGFALDLLGARLTL